MELIGTVTKFRYKSDTSSFKIAEFTPVNLKDGELVLLKGSIDQSNLGMSVTLRGDWVEDPKYGRQFLVQECLRNLPTDVKGIVGWLEKQKGLGKKTAEAIGKKFGSNLKNILNNEWEKLAEVKRVSTIRANSIHKAWIENVLLREVQLLLIQGGLPSSENYSKKIVARFGQDSLARIEDNPYRLTEVSGIGFKSADNMARQLGWSLQRPERVEAAAAFLLEEAAQEGHSFLHKAELSDAIRKLASIEKEGNTELLPEEDALAAINSVIEKGDVILEKVTINKQESFLCYLPYYHELEVMAAKRVAVLLSMPQVPPNNIDKVLKKVEKKLGFELSIEQREAVIQAITNNCSVITGLPGTGKSSACKALVQTAKALGLRVMIAAPTGRAAKRVQELTECEAKTIHRTLMYDPKFDEFGYNSNNLLPCDMLIVDEASMLNLELMVAVLEAIPDSCSVVWIGDINQLASIGAGAALRDLINSKRVFTTTLTKIFRQAEGSLIIQNAHRIFRGEMPKFPDKGVDADSYWIPVPKAMSASGKESDDIDFVKAQLPPIYRRLESRFKIDPIKDIQVLTPMKVGNAGSIAFNTLIQSIVNPKGERFEINNQVFRIGDRVMQTVNDYTLDIYNGDIGFIRSIDTENKIIDIEFFGKDIDYPFESIGNLMLAYSSSIHKCIDPNTYVETNKGIYKAGSLDNKGIIATPTGSKEYTNKIVNNTSLVYEINTTYGYSLSVSSDHGLQSWDGKEWKRKDAKDLAEGDWLRLKPGITIDNTNFVELPVPPEVNGRSAVYPLPSIMTKDLGEFLGLMVGDGTVYFRGFRLVKKHIEVVNRFKELCISLFGVKAKDICILGTPGAEVNSTFLSAWLLKFNGLSPNNKTVPDVIMKASPEIQKSFLKGLFEDGTVNLKNRKIDHIEWSSKYKELAETIHFLLLRLGVASTKKHVKKQWILYIYNSFIKVFKDNINFISNFKRNRLNLELATKNEIRFILPISKEEVKSIKSVMSLTDKSNAYSRGYISINVANKVVNSNNETVFLKERLKWLHVRIKSINKRIGPTVCVEVPDGNRFLQNGFDGWNSQGSEFKAVIIVLLNQHWIMLDRNIIYTANTRARQIAVYLSSKDAVETAVNTQKVLKRNSLLALRIRTAVGKKEYEKS